MSAQLLGNVTYLGDPPCLQPRNVAKDHTPQAGLVDMLEPGLEAPDVFLDLLEEGQIVGQFRQSWIRRDPRLIDRGCAGRDQYCIERIVLGAAQMHPAKCLDLDRLQHQDREARRPQMLHDAAFIAAGRLDTDARHAGLGQVGQQSAPARQSVGDLPAFGPAMNRNIEFALDVSIPAVVMLVCVIFVDPAL